ncbi:MAG: hypothetical protein AB8H79_17865, partial [Myxococcota bacterium]
AALAYHDRADTAALSLVGFVVSRFLAAAGVSDNTWTSGPPAHVSAAEWAVWRPALQAHAERRDATADRHNAASRELSSAANGAPVWPLPYLPTGLRSAGGLAQLARFLPPLRSAE